MDVLVAGGGGFIGGHLVADLLAQGKSVRSVDIKPLDEWHQVHRGADNQIADLSLLDQAIAATQGAREVYMLAADMGGMGFIELHKAACMLSVLTSTHMLQAARHHGVERYFYSSSACVYPAALQTGSDVTALRESDVYPAMPEDGYGWEKLFSERMCHHFEQDFGLVTRVGRYHNVYGPHGTWDGGREKAPAAICRKIAIAEITGEHRIEIWGDGEQTRSFTYIDDCLEGTQLVMGGASKEPVNIGSSELVTINQLVALVEEIAGIRCDRDFRLDAPLGVRGRNSDNTLILERYGWAPSTSLADGMERTYRWVRDEVKRSLG
ncbi:NAD-dependent dehydratase [Nocardioides gansuensis]|uniref:NAD-dependent dehydratase n=1 Tax=Nocardioides gansuensis TaxID=2138300 RepID=A0A2T8FGN4_9ACTN|nr:NAD-dependent epimerase/dehydratase family protein [Nocardioides gansuensis]PVG84864.1 NAD-dependent dehydratase [Nocardioides gansuensis]